MKLLFIEPDDRFYHWVEDRIHANSSHRIERCKSVSEAQEKLATGTFDACVVDDNLFDESCDTLAHARLACSSCPLIVLTGKEVRADLMKICDGILLRNSITHPSVDIPNAVTEAQQKGDAPLAAGSQLLQLVISMRSAKNKAMGELESIFAKPTAA